jgi:hypothetical protein
MTHVAAVAVREGTPYVYESAPGVGVRRLPMDEYLAAQHAEVFHVFQSKDRFSREQEQAFVAGLESRLGRPYSVVHHVTGRRANGLHCAEYVTDALVGCKLLDETRPPRVSPAALARIVADTGVYARSETIVLDPEAEPIVGRNWCVRTWLRTKRCTVACCKQMSRWFFCK